MSDLTKLNDTETHHPLPLADGISNYIRQAAIGMTSGVIANTATTPLYIAWTKKQFGPFIPTSRIFKEMFSFRGLKENIKVIRVNFPMSLRHALGFFTVVNTSMVYLEKTSYPSFVKGFLAGAISALPETILTYNATRTIVDIVGNNKTKNMQQLQLLLFSMQLLFDKNHTKKNSNIGRELQRSKRTFCVTLLKNTVANSLTMAFAYYFKNKLEDYQPGRVYNPALAGVLGASVASPFFMPFVVIQTVTLNKKNIDNSIMKNTKRIISKESFRQLWRGGLLRPFHKGVAAGVTFANTQLLNDMCDMYLAP